MKVYMIEVCKKVTGPLRVQLYGSVGRSLPSQEHQKQRPICVKRKSGRRRNMKLLVHAGS